MTAVHLLVSRVRGRLRTRRALRYAGIALLCGLWLVFGVVALSKLLPGLENAWLYALYAIGAALPVAFIVGWWRRVTLLEAAVLSDQRLALRERLSTALALEQGAGDDAFVAALLRDAEAHAQRAEAARVAPLGLSPVYKLSLLPLVLAVGVWFVPALSYATVDTDRDRKMAVTRVEVPMPERARELEQLAEVVRSASDAKTAPEFDRMAKEIEKIAEQLRKGKKTERKAMAELSKIEEKLEQNREQLAGKMSAARAVKKLDSGPMKDVASDLRKGQFSQAAQRLAAMRETLEQGDLSEQRKNEIAEAMKDLAKQLAASDSQMSDALASAAAKLSSGDPKQASEALAGLEQKLSDMQDALNQMAILDKLASACKSCKSGMCNSATGSKSMCSSCGKMGCKGNGKGNCFAQGPWKPGDSRKQGRGFGGPGIGRGGQVPIAEGGPTAFQPDRLKGKQLDQGEIVASMMVKGEQLTGESAVEFSDVVMEYRQQAEDTLSKETVPLGYRRYVQQYFEAIDPNSDLQVPPDESPQAPETEIADSP